MLSIESKGSEENKEANAKEQKSAVFGREIKVLMNNNYWTFWNTRQNDCFLTCRGLWLVHKRKDEQVPLGKEKIVMATMLSQKMGLEDESNLSRGGVSRLEKK